MAVLMSAVLLSSILHCITGIPIDGPQPMSVLAPLGTEMAFTCIANITELTVERFFDIVWAVDGVPLPGGNITENGLLRTGLLQYYSMSEDTSVFVQCAVLARDAPWSLTITVP